MEKLRHSLAHLLAAAILELYPNTLNTIGPAIEDGFYYDFEFSKTPSPSGHSPFAGGEEELAKIEKKMREILKTWKEFEGKEVTEKEARKIYKDNPYKLELIDEIVNKKEKITLYKSGEFTDLCRGGHVDNIKEIKPDAFKLDRIAGAYWRGSEKNKMLTRIYGLAFETKKGLEDYLKQREEAEKRDHRKLGKELEIFTFDDDVGPGLPLWLPNGAILIEELEKLAKETEERAGYVRVKTPHLAKESMYLKSGHLPYYKDSTYPPMEIEGQNYYLKAMNCPHHHKIFASKQRSYRDLPLRLAEYGTCYRYEKSGELFGLMRTRSLQMNDAHIYCSKEQFAEEFKKVNEMYLNYFKIFGIEKYLMRFSTHNPKKLGEKYVNEPELWLETEKMVREVLIESKIPYTEVADEAAFYGPKIDVEVWSAIGREFTLATNQVDFAGPLRFNLVFVNKESKNEHPIIIHRAPLGTHERFIGFLIEHYAGAFPLWLSPLQVAVLSISEEKHGDYAKEIYEKLRAEDIRAELWNENESISKKIRNFRLKKIPYAIVIGDKEKESGKLTIETRAGEKIQNISAEEFIEKLKKEIGEKK